MEDANPEGDYSSDGDESEGVVVQMEGNEMGEEQKIENIEDGGDDEEMLDDY